MNKTDKVETAKEVVQRVVNRCIAEGSPVIVEQPVTDAGNAPREFKFYREDESGDYLAVDPSTNQYYLDNLKEDCFEARATAIANDVNSVCTTSISRGFLATQATEVSRSQVPAEWLAQFE